MGAGCYYTHAANKQKACWVEIESGDESDGDYEDDFDTYGWALENITDLLNANGYRNLKNGLFKIELKSTYYGEGIIIELVPNCKDYDCTYSLAMANFNRVEERILRLIHNEGFKLRIATSGHTAIKYVPTQLKNKKK